MIGPCSPIVDTVAVCRCPFPGSATATAQHPSMSNMLTASQICGYDGGDCCASTCQPVTFAQFYGSTAAQAAPGATTANTTDTDGNDQLPYSCRHAFSPRSSLWAFAPLRPASCAALRPGHGLRTKFGVFIVHINMSCKASRRAIGILMPHPSNELRDGRRLQRTLCEVHKCWISRMSGSNLL